jgi:putative ATP-dependent endonuclease of the OLD family
MYIAAVHIKNFRSFGPEVTKIELETALTGVVGHNSSGKTALLECFRKAFSPYLGERSLLRSDFHFPNGATAEEVERIDLQMEFHFKFESVDDAVPEFWEGLTVSEPDGDPVLRIRLEATWTRNALTVEGEIEQRLVIIKATGEEIDEGDKVPFPNRQRALTQTLYIPAIRRPSEQMRYAAGSLLHRLFQHVKWSEDFQNAFKQQLEDTDQLFQGEGGFGDIQSSLGDTWKEFHKDERYQEATLHVNGPDLDSVLKKLEIRFSPGDIDRSYSIDELGDGYRSLFYLTLVGTVLKMEQDWEADEGAKPLLTIVLVEEPENHIAPQLLGRVIRNLKDMGELENVQVLLSSHTPAIIRRIEPEAIRHLRLDKATRATFANRLTLPDAKDVAFTYIKEAVRNYPEIYFAQLVVIGEGDSEQVVFERLMKAYGKDFDDHMISFAPLGNRFVNHIWRLLYQLEIPFVTLLDLDKERNGGGWGRIKYALTQLLDIGVVRSELLAIKGGVEMSADKLEEMHKRDEKLIKSQTAWMNRLEEHSVFFSQPLDLDFALLEAYPEAYNGILSKGEGPRVPKKDKYPAKFQEKVEKGIEATLKSEEATAATYSETQKELMIWYNYHFLGRGKPSTHIQALQMLTDKELKKKLPPYLMRMFDEIQEKLD